MDNKCVEKLLETVAFSNGCICFVELIQREHRHFHPSGNFTPSKEDFLVTTKMCIGGDILGIDVWDHIIIAGGSGKRYSMAEQGKMQEFRNRWKEAGEFVADPLFQPPAKEQRFGKHL